MKHLGLQSRYEELKAKFSKSTKDILDGTNKTVQRVTEALERQAMRVEELELFRLEEQQASSALIQLVNILCLTFQGVFFS